MVDLLEHRSSLLWKPLIALSLLPRCGIEAMPSAALSKRRTEGNQAVHRTHTLPAKTMHFHNGSEIQPMVLKVDVGILQDRERLVELQTNDSIALVFVSALSVAALVQLLCELGHGGR